MKTIFLTLMRMLITAKEKKQEDDEEYPRTAKSFTLIQINNAYSLLMKNIVALIPNELEICDIYLPIQRTIVVFLLGHENISRKH